MMSRRIWPAAILTTYGLLVLSLLGVTPLWLDEVGQFGRAYPQSAKDLLGWVLHNPAASPLPYFLQKMCVDWLGFSAWTARLPAALCSIAGATVFWLASEEEVWRTRIVALLMLMALPLQFRYALEARVYSQGLLCSLITYWLFRVLCRRTDARQTVLYWASIVLGLYSQPFTGFPVAGQALWACWPGRERRLRWTVLASAAVAVATFVPWFLWQRHTMAPTEWSYAFSIRQIRPLSLLHEFSGGGFVCSIAILALCAMGIAITRRGDTTWLLIAMAGVSIAGPLISDATFSYFFANRQFLFAMPAVVLLAARGADALMERHPPVVAWILLGAFFGAACVSDYRLATVPKDEVVAGSATLAARLRQGGCFLTAPPTWAFNVVFLHPELRDRTCGEHPNQDEIYELSNQFTSVEEHARFAQQLGGRYQLEETISVGRTVIQRYRKRLQVGVGLQAAP